jgi:hypothetical protein
MPTSAENLRKLAEIINIASVQEGLKLRLSNHPANHPDRIEIAQRYMAGALNQHLELCLGLLGLTPEELKKLVDQCKN